MANSGGSFLEDGYPRAQLGQAVEMAYRVDLAEDAGAVDDLRAVPAPYRGAVRATLERLEREGPCIGIRLRGSGLDDFCRIAVPTRGGKESWRIIYRWPPDEQDEAETIVAYAIGRETRSTDDVYARFERYLGTSGVKTGAWSAAEPRLSCCGGDASTPA